MIKISTHFQVYLTNKCMLTQPNWFVSFKSMNYNVSAIFFFLNRLHFVEGNRDMIFKPPSNNFKAKSSWYFLRNIPPKATIDIPETTPKRWMIVSNKSSCHFLLDIQLLYLILENVTDVYNGTHFDGAIQNKKLSNFLRIKKLKRAVISHFYVVVHCKVAHCFSIWISKFTVFCECLQPVIGIFLWHKMI